MTNYGTIDLLWFDFSYDDMTGEKWQATKLMEMIRSLQPHVIVDNRLGGDLKLSDPPVYAGDFVSPEQIIPPEGVTNEEGRLLPWEACITLNRHWGYCLSLIHIFIALSACLAGDIPQALLAGDKRRAEHIALEYAEIFGRENFYLELQNHGLEDQLRVNAGL